MSANEVLPQFEQFTLADGVEPDLIEESQQPGLALLEIGGLAVAVPHFPGAPDKLITARAFHAVNAQVGSPYSHGILRRPGACRIVFGSNQPVARVDGGGDRRTQVDVAQAHYEIA